MLESDDMSHEGTEPLRIQEIELTQLGLQVTVMEDDSTLMKKLNGLLKLRFVHLEIQLVLFNEFS